MAVLTLILTIYNFKLVISNEKDSEWSEICIGSKIVAELNWRINIFSIIRDVFNIFAVPSH